MIQYGLISQIDARTLEKTIDLICNEFTDENINVTEIGLFDCGTSKGISTYILFNKLRGVHYIGIDNEKDKKIIASNYMQLIKGNSNEVYNQLQDNSQHLIFIDGDHSYIGVISDFYSYCDKVKAGGYLAFHDTGKHIKRLKDFQHGDKNNPDAYISVRKALNKIGLLSDNTLEWSSVNCEFIGFELIFDEADETDECGGICVFKRLY